MKSNKDKYSTCSSLLTEARAASDKTQQYMADKMGLSRSTIYSWENGQSAPDVPQAIEWFSILDKSPMPYLMRFLYPEHEHAIGSKVKAKLALHSRVDHLSEADAEKLLFILNGLSGSSPTGIINLITAYSHLPLLFKVISSKSLLTSYLTAESLGMLINPSEAAPDIDFLKDIIIKASEALSSGKESYL